MAASWWTGRTMSRFTRRRGGAESRAVKNVPVQPRIHERPDAESRDKSGHDEVSRTLENLVMPRLVRGIHVPLRDATWAVSHIADDTLPPRRRGFACNFLAVPA